MYFINNINKIIHQIAFYKGTKLQGSCLLCVTREITYPIFINQYKHINVYIINKYGFVIMKILFFML